MFNTIKKLSTLYFVDVMGICCMGNHFHGVVQMNPDHDFTDEEIQTRYKKYYNDKKELFDRLLRNPNSPKLRHNKFNGLRFENK